MVEVDTLWLNIAAQHTEVMAPYLEMDLLSNLSLKLMIILVSFTIDLYVLVINLQWLMTQNVSSLTFHLRAKQFIPTSIQFLNLSASSLVHP